MEKKNIFSGFTALLFLLAMQFVAFQFCFADVPGDHPHYLHALSDLRMARAYLDKLTASEQQDVMELNAIEEINKAIKEIKMAAIDDGKDIMDHPAIDAALNKTDRFRKAMELLNKVHNDITKGEDNIFADGLQARAIGHIDAARDILKGIIAKFDNFNQHPAYLHALSDLRMARGYLDKITPDEVLNDMSVSAIDEINKAIGEIKLAAIDDGKDISDHPAIDAGLKRADRYVKVIELLNKVHKDIKQGESNVFAKGLQKRALKHIDMARDIVKGITE
jgi:tetratricopeptide (TPR) repeat protein